MNEVDRPFALRLSGLPRVEALSEEQVVLYRVSFLRLWPTNDEHWLHEALSAVSLRVALK
jgi:hypothetical protein